MRNFPQLALQSSDYSTVTMNHDEHLPKDPAIGEPERLHLIHEELRDLARIAMSRERPDHTLQPSALVTEAYIRLTRDRPGSWNSRAHFFSAAARAMRQILVDHARNHNAVKRASSHERIALQESHASFEANPELVLAVDASLDRLRELDPRAAQVVELRFFTGLSVEETAELMAVSPKTVKRDWEFARVWLEQQLCPLEKTSL